MKCDIKFRCPYCNYMGYKEFNNYANYELNLNEIVKCCKCSEKYVVCLFAKVESLDKKEYDIYSSDKARNEHQDVKKVIKLLNDIIKLYEEETNYFVIDLKRHLPKVVVDPGPVSDLEDYIINNGNIPFEILELYKKNGYRVNVNYDENFWRLKMSW